MAYTNINSEDRLVQATFAEHLQRQLGWQSVYAYNEETFGASGTLGRTDPREVVLTRDLRAAIIRLNPQLPEAADGTLNNRFLAVRELKITGLRASLQPPG